MASKSRVDHYQILATLGFGSSGKVKLALDTSSGVQVALKLLKRDAPNAVSIETLRVWRREIQALQSLNHPNIVRIIEVSEDSLYYSKTGRTYRVLYIALEFCEHGDLYDLVWYAGRFRDELARTYFKQLLEALAACHSQEIAHRDIKPENVLFDGEFNLKLADFGFSGMLTGSDGTGLMKTWLGTEAYMAPEVLAGQAYSGQSVDLFACGVVLFILKSRHPAFGKAVETDAYYRHFTVQNAKFWQLQARNKPPNFYTEDFKSLLNGLLAQNPSDRLSLSEIQTHPWVLGPTLTLPELQTEMRERAALTKYKKKEASRTSIDGPTLGHRSGSSSPLDFRQLKPWVPAVKKCSQLFLDLPPSQIFKEIGELFTNKRVKVKENREKFKMKAEFTDGNYGKFELELFDAGEGAVCVDFSKVEGDFFEFMDVFTEVEQIFREIMQI